MRIGEVVSEDVMCGSLLSFLVPMKNLLKLNPPNQYSGSSGAVAVSKKALFKGTDCDRCVILKFIMDIAIGSPSPAPLIPLRAKHSAKTTFSIRQSFLRERTNPARA